MVEINIVYQNDLHCMATHEPSGTKLFTDAPKDNQGKGESFSPTDLLATSLGTCILSIMGIAARAMQVDLTGATANVHKEMTTKPTRRIGALAVIIEVPTSPSEAQKQELIKAAHACPVHKSLHPDIQISVEFRWG
jgi:putative redox protein